MTLVIGMIGELHDPATFILKGSLRHLHEDLRQSGCIAARIFN